MATKISPLGVVGPGGVILVAMVPTTPKRRNPGCHRAATSGDKS